MGGQPLMIPVKNWFDHTNFNELTMVWSVGMDQGRLALELAPGAEGQLVIPGRNWRADDVMHLQFYSQPPSEPILIDEFKLPLKGREVALPILAGPKLQLVESAEMVTVENENVRLVVDKAAGQIVEASYRGRVVLTGGPQLNLCPYDLPPLQAEEVRAIQNADYVEIAIDGAYGEMPVRFTIRVDGAGRMETTYTLPEPPADAGSYSEVGVSFLMPGETDRLRWDRRALWSVYPEDHIGRPVGEAARFRAGPAAVYRQEPTWSWSLDMEDYPAVGARTMRDMG